MKKRLFIFLNQAQEFALRLFIEKGGYTPPSDSQYYTCAHCGTHTRVH